MRMPRDKKSIVSTAVGAGHITVVLPETAATTISEWKRTRR